MAAPLEVRYELDAEGDFERNTVALFVYGLILHVLTDTVLALQASQTVQRRWVSCVVWTHHTFWGSLVLMAKYCCSCCNGRGRSGSTHRASGSSSSTAGPSHSGTSGPIRLRPLRATLTQLPVSPTEHNATAEATIPGLVDEYVDDV